MIRQWFIGIAAVCTLWGCNRSEMNGTPAGQPSEEGKMAVTLQLSSDTPLKAADPDSKANVTESATDETLVANMVVLQYDMRNDEGQLVGMQFVNGVTQSGSNVKVSVSLEPLRKTRVVVLANMNGFFDSERVAIGTSLEVLNSLTYDITATAGAGIPNDYNTALPMRAESGDITLTEGQVDQLTLTLYRLVAKVEFTLYNLCRDTEADKYFEVSSVTLKNVPAMGTYERVTETNYVDEQFPVRDLDNFMSYSPVGSNKFTEQATTCVWYMAPNNGGTGKGTTALDKMDPANVPSNFCSYVEVSGKIYIQSTPYPVVYRLYLGRNNTNDYNVWANEQNRVYMVIRSLPDDPEDIPDAGFDGFRIEMQSAQMHNSTVTGWAPGILDVSVSPSPKAIPHTGGEYTITLVGSESWGDPVPVRVWDGSEAVAQGTVAYDQYQEGGHIVFYIPENKTQAARSLTFQFQWNDTWITFDGGTQFSTALESIEVSPDPLNIPYQGDTYTITFDGLWSGEIPVRIWNATTNAEVASGAVSYDGEHSIDLAIPQNATQRIYSMEFQYLWEEVWATVRSGLQLPQDYVTTGSVSPDPTTIPVTGSNYIVTLNGLWNGSVEIRAWDGTTELASGAVACIMEGESGSGSTSLTVPANNASGAEERTVRFQYRLSGGQWIDIDQGQQKSREVTEATVSPDPTNISYQETEFTVTLTGVWAEAVPIRAIVEGQSEALVSEEVTDSGLGVQLTVPMNSATTPRTVIFQYQWEGQWVEIDRGVQQDVGYHIESATVSPDPSDGFSGSATAFTVTLTGKWEGSVPVRAIVDGQDQALVSGSVTTSGTGVQLTVPANSSTTSARTVLFQYQWDNKWVEIDRGTQAAQESIDQGGGTEISPDPGSKMTWDQAVAYCKNKGTGWRLPTQNESMYLYCLEPSFTGEAAFSAGYYWSATQISSDSKTVWGVYFGSGYTGSLTKTFSYYVRCVRDKGTSGAYPYITTATGGVVIVLRDDKGGVDEANLFPYRLTASPTGDEQSTDNRMSRKIRVQKVQGQSSKVTWDNAVSYCDNLTDEGFSDWRLPTQRELMLIWNLGGNSQVTSGDKNDTGVGSGSVPLYTPYLYQQSGFTPFSGDYYWSATQSLAGSGNAWAVAFAYGFPYSGSTGNYLKTSTISVRCVRDEW